MASLWSHIRASLDQGRAHQVPEDPQTATFSSSDELVDEDDYKSGLIVPEPGNSDHADESAGDGETTNNHENNAETGNTDGDDAPPPPPAELSAAALLLESQHQLLESHRQQMMDSTQILIQQEMRKQKVLDSMYTLHKDTYSLLLTCDCGTVMFAVAMATWAVAIALYALALVSITDFDSSSSSSNTSADNNNPLNIPAGVEVSVTAAQFISIGIAVLVQSSLRECIFVVENFQRILNIVPNVTRTRIYICFGTKLVETLMSLLLILILICQSEDVINLLKDFPALLFISSLDNIVFAVGQEGYMGRRFRNATTETQNVRFSPTGAAGSKREATIRFLVMASVHLSMLVSWLILCPIRQQNGYYLVDRVAVQFPLASDGSLQYFTGIYRQEGSHDSRVKYVETTTNPDSQTSSTAAAAATTTTTQGKNRRAQAATTTTTRYPAYFAYCADLRAWVFVTGGGGEGSPCSEHKAISEEYSGYDLSEAKSLSWYLNDGTDKREPLQDLFFREYYETDPDFEAVDRFGLFGEFDLPCATLHLDELKGRFFTTREFASEYSLLLDDGGSIVKVYERPVYFNDETLDLILFTGSAWILTGATFLHDHDPASNLATYLVNEFHAYWSKYDVFLVTKHVVFSSEGDYATPVGLNWHAFNPQTRAADLTQSVEATLLCAICDTEKNPCFYEGECQADGSCFCRTGSSGVLCQVPPTSNGLCNPFFNNLAFAWDGGDCCKATCHSTDSFLCGLDETKRFHRDFVQCKDPDTSFACSESGEQCWKPGGDSIFGEGNNAESGFSISSFGNVLAVGEPGSNSVRVFDRYGAEYTYRDSLPVVGSQVRFGSSVSVSGSKHIRGSPTAPSRPVVAASGVGKFYVFQWSEDNVWEDISPEVQLFNGIHPALLSVGLYQESKTVASFEFNADGLFGQATVWKRQSRDSLWELTGIITCNCSDFAMSGDGTHLVAAHASVETASLHVFDTIANAYQEIGVVELGLVPKSMKLSESGSVLAVLGVRNGNEYRQELCLFDRTAHAGIYVKRKLCTRSVEISTAVKDSIEVNEDGSIVAVAMKEANKIRSLRYNNGVWQDFEEDLDGYSFSMNDAEIVVGLPSDDTAGSNSGKVSTFGRHTVVCKPDEVLVEVSILLDDRPERTWWQLYDHTDGLVFAQNGPYETLDANLAVYHGDMCVSNQHCLTLFVYDTQGSGISCQYSVAVDGNPMDVNLSRQGLVDFVDISPGTDCGRAEKPPGMAMLQTPLFALCSNTTCEVSPSGNDMWGSKDNERFGTRTSISHDGNLLAVSSVSSTFAGHVRVFAKSESNDTWVQLGNSLSDKSSDEGTEHRFGEALALAREAAVVVCGAPKLFYWFQVPGYVEVYEHQGGDWVKKGSTVEGRSTSAPFASSVAISDDGNVIAVGAMPALVWGVVEGFVGYYVFDKASNDWIRQGNQTLGDGCGEGLALSGNGKVLAFGCRNQGHSRRIIRVFEYDDKSSDFHRLGGDEIHGVDEYDQVGTSRPQDSLFDFDGIGWRHGDAISLSKDGLTMAVGSLDRGPSLSFDPKETYVSYVKVWRFDSTTNTWNQLGQTLAEIPDDEAGIVSLSSDGFMLCVGAPGTQFDDIGNGVGSVRVYYFAESINTWCQLGVETRGNEPMGFFGNSVSFAGEGLRFAAAAYTLDGAEATSSGRVRVFDIKPVTWSLENDPVSGCGVGHFPFQVDIKLDLHPEDIKHLVRDSNSNVLVSSSFEDQLPGDHLVETHCLPENEALRYDIEDKFGDGLCCDNGEGWFQVSKKGDPVLNGSDFGSSVSLCLTPGHAPVNVVFEELGTPRSSFKNRLMFLSHDGSETELLSFSRQDGLGKTDLSFNICAPKGCLVFVAQDMNRLSVSLSYEGYIQHGTGDSWIQMKTADFQAFWFGECPQLCSTELAQVSVDRMSNQIPHQLPYEVSWSLVDSSGTGLWDHGSPPALEATNHWACVPSNTCLVFTFDVNLTDDSMFHTPWRGGYSVWLNGELEADYHAEEMRYPKFHQFGSCRLTLCEDGEALLRILARTGPITHQPGGPSNSGKYSVWSIFGGRGRGAEAVITHGYTEADSDKAFEYKFCLPTGGPNVFHFRGDAAEYRVFWDGELLDSSEGFAAFGEDMTCTQGDYAVDIFVETDDYHPEEMFWALRDRNNTTTLLSVDGYPNKWRKLFHHSTCVSDSCGHFVLRGDPAARVEQLQVFLDGRLAVSVVGLEQMREKQHFELPFCLSTSSPTTGPTNSTFWFP